MYSKILLVTLIALTTTMNGVSQSQLSAFDPFIGREWVSDKSHPDFQQTVSMAYSLDSMLVLVKSYGHIDQNKQKWGLRNHGVRSYNTEGETIKFWEFDIFGGVTEGTVTTEGRNLYYDYNYGDAQKLNLTDAWEYVDESTYQFTVGQRKEDGTWSAKYIETTFTAYPVYEGPRADVDSILMQTQRFSQAYMNEDISQLSNYYTIDGKIFPNGTPIISGRPAIYKRWQTGDDNDILSHRVTPIEIVVHGDTAYDYGYYSGSNQVKGKDLQEWKGKYVIVWKKVNDEWLIHLDIWNSVRD